MKPLSVPERLTKNRFNLDEEESHIEVNQEIAKATGTGKALVACCPAHVYSEEPDGTISVEYAACLECGTCLAIAAPGALQLALPPRRVRRPVPRGLVPFPPNKPDREYYSRSGLCVACPAVRLIRAPGGQAYPGSCGQLTCPAHSR